MCESPWATSSYYASQAELEMNSGRKAMLFNDFALEALIGQMSFDQYIKRYQTQVAAALCSL